MCSCATRAASSAEYDREHSEGEPGRAERRGEHDWDQGEYQQQDRSGRPPARCEMGYAPAGSSYGDMPGEALHGGHDLLGARRCRQAVAAVQELAQVRVDVRRHLDHQRRVGIARAQFAQDLSGLVLLVAQGADDEVGVVSGGAPRGPGQRTLPVSPLGRDRWRLRNRRSAGRRRSQGRSPRPGARRAPAGGSSAKAAV